jgi:Helix-turn-helix family
MTITNSTIDPARTQPALRSIETGFSASVLYPGVQEALQGLGLDVRDVADVNIVTRAAAMRSDNPELVWSTFFNPNPERINALVPTMGHAASFDAILTTQADVLDEPFAKATASMDPNDLRQLASLCRTVTEAANQNCEGRPLFAGLASLPLPADDHMMVWHAARLLREHRGDGHIAALVVEGLGRIDALVVHAAMLPMMADGLRRSRRWSIDEWKVSMASLRQRGWLTDDDEPTFTPEGQARREWIEDRTNELAAVAFDGIGNDGVDRLIELGARYTAALEAGGMGSTLRIAIPMSD